MTEWIIREFGINFKQVEVVMNHKGKKSSRYVDGNTMSKRIFKWIRLVNRSVIVINIKLCVILTKSYLFCVSR